MSLKFRDKSKVVVTFVVTATKELGSGVVRVMSEFENGKFGDKKETQFLAADLNGGEDASQYTRTLIDTVKRGCVVSMSGAPTRKQSSDGKEVIVLENARLISIVAMSASPDAAFVPNQPSVVLPAVKIAAARRTAKDSKTYHSFSFVFSETVDDEDIQSNGYPATVESLWGKFLITTRPTTPESVTARIEAIEKGTVLTLSGTMAIDVSKGKDGREFVNLQVNAAAWEVISAGSSNYDGGGEYSEAEDTIGF